MRNMAGLKSAPIVHNEFYVAVGTQECKLTTLLELLLALIQEQPSISLLVCCSSRDSLDAVAHGIALLNKFSLWALHSDLTPRELSLQVLGFRQAASAALVPGPTAAAAAGSEPAGATDTHAAGGGLPQDPAPAEPQPSISNTRAAASQRQPVVLVATDSSLRALGKESLPLGVAAAVQYDLPPNKEVYLRRVAASFGSSRERKGGRRGVVVDFVVAGLVGAFRELEGFSLSPVQEMPVQVHDMFL